MGYYIMIEEEKHPYALARELNNLLLAKYEKEFNGDPWPAMTGHLTALLGIMAGESPEGLAFLKEKVEQEKNKLS